VDCPAWDQVIDQAWTPPLEGRAFPIVAELLSVAMKKSPLVARSRSPLVAR
jgi:hypothetical protein